MQAARAELGKTAEEAAALRKGLASTGEGMHGEAQEFQLALQAQPEASIDKATMAQLQTVEQLLMQSQSEKQVAQP